MDYKLLRLKIIAEYGTLSAFAEAMSMSITAISQRLNNQTEWRTSDIAKACALLNIPLEETHVYFFTKAAVTEVVT